MCDNLLESKVEHLDYHIFFTEGLPCYRYKIFIFGFSFLKKKNIFGFSLYLRVRDHTPNHLFNKYKSLTT